MNYESYTLMNRNILYDAIEAPSTSEFSYMPPPSFVLLPHIVPIGDVPKLITSHTNTMFFLSNSLLNIYLNVKQMYSTLMSNLNIIGVANVTIKTCCLYKHHSPFTKVTKFIVIM